MELTSENVNKVMMGCLFKEDTKENQERAIKVRGIMGNFGLNPDAVEKHEEDIISMLKQLPHQFQEKSGGGWSFLNACDREDGIQWTSLHQAMEVLVVLGIAARWAVFTLPRDMWEALPGGMPYFVVFDKRKDG